MHISRSIQWSLGSVAAGLMLGTLGLGAFQAADQTPAPAPAPKAANKGPNPSEADHQAMLDLLHIDKLRRRRGWQQQAGSQLCQLRRVESKSVPRSSRSSGVEERQER